MRSAVEWIESLTPWPEEFGLDRMRALLAELGNPQRDYPSIHVVGHERQVDRGQDDRGAARAGRARRRRLSLAACPRLERANPGARRGSRLRAGRRARAGGGRGTRRDAVRGAHRSRPGRVRGGRRRRCGRRGGPRRAASTRRTSSMRRSSCSRTSPSSTPRCSARRGRRSHERSSRSQGRRQPSSWGSRSGSRSFLVAAWSRAVPGRPPRRFSAMRCRLIPRSRLRAGGRCAEKSRSKSGTALTTLAGVEYLATRAGEREWVVVASVLRDKDVEAMLRTLRGLGRTFVATTSSNARALSAADLSRLADRYFDDVEAVEDSFEALARARELAGPAGAVLVTGSLYLLADLNVRLQGVP